MKRNDVLIRESISPRCSVTGSRRPPPWRMSALPFMKAKSYRLSARAEAAKRHWRNDHGPAEGERGTIEYMGKPKALKRHRDRKRYWKNIQAIFQDPFSSFNLFYKVEKLRSIASSAGR